MPDQIDPTSDSAPLHVLMSLSGNPAIRDMTDDEVAALIKTFRGIASPVALAAKIKSEKAKPRPKSAVVAAKMQDMFDRL